MTANIQAVADAVRKGKTRDIDNVILAALKEGCTPIDIFNTAIVDVIARAEEQFKRNEIFVPEMILITLAIKKGFEFLKPYLFVKEPVFRGKCILAVVEGDYYEIGKDLVAMLLESVGFEVIDLGTNVPAEKIIWEYRRNTDVKLIGLSSHVPETLSVLKTTVIMLNQYEFREKIRLVIGGSTITKEFAESVGADGCCEGIKDIMKIVRNLY